MRQTAAILITVAAAAAFYFSALGRADIVTDESSYATRAIGLVDFDFGIEQPTPWQLVNEIPWWMRLSFHDHPPLVFWLQHLSIRLFGENPVAIRIPSALAGVASVLFLYAIGRQLYSPTVGALGALLFAVTANHVWISRIGLQESVLIALMLASASCFFRALLPSTSVTVGRPIVTGDAIVKKKSGWWLLASGLLLGFAFLTKYNALVLVPIFTTILLFRRLRKSASKPESLPSTNASLRYAYDRNHNVIWRKEALLAVLAFLVVASPVIIYNIQLYRNFGHFDFQFSLLFSQDVAAWQSRPGQEALGSYRDRIRDFIPRLIEANSPYFLILAAGGLALILWQALRQYRRGQESMSSEQDRTILLTAHWSLLVVLAWLLPFIIFIGPARRFLTLLTPWLALAAGFGLTAIIQLIHPYILKYVRMFSLGVPAAALALIIAGETFYAYNSVIAIAPRGETPWAYSILRREAHAWGFHELEAYLANTLKEKMPAIGITFEFPFSRQLLNEAAARGQAEGREAVPWGIVYNDNISLSAQLWIFLRRISYEGWPVMSAEHFRREGGAEFLRKAGIERIIFINATDYALQDRARPPAPDGDLMEEWLRAEGLAPREIKNARDEIAFRVYEFALR